jgi:hypothetical protein
MALRKGTAAEIRAVIAQRIRNSTELNGDCCNSAAPTPLWSESPNSKGTHWTVLTIPQARPDECFEFVNARVLEVMATHELIRSN